MKAKRKTNLILAAALFFCVLAAAMLWPGKAQAAQENVGDFTVTYNTAVRNYTYDNTTHELKVSKDADLTISNTNSGTPTTHTIVVEGDADITLAGVNINVSSEGNPNACAFAIQKNVTLNLTLTSGNYLTSGQNCAGLEAPADQSLIIDGDGSLDATGGSEGAGIGGGKNETGGTITINSGTVTARGGSNGAGIGGGNQGAGGNITINGGEVTANGGATGTGIGGGNQGAGGKITISGGTVTATGSDGGAGIGGGENGAGATVIIDGGSVKASSDYGQPISDNPKNRDNAPLSLAVLTVNNAANQRVTQLKAGIYTGTDKTDPTQFGNNEYGIHDMYTDDQGKVYLYLPKDGVEGKFAGLNLDNNGENDLYSGVFIKRSATLKPFTGAIDLSATGGNLYIWDDGYGIGPDASEAKKVKIPYTGDYTLRGTTTANTVTVMKEYNAAGGSKTITLAGLNIDVHHQDNKCAFYIGEATVNLSLEAGLPNSLKSGKTGPGLHVGRDASLTISGGGSLDATGNTMGAGIGGSQSETGGTITILGGTVTATGGENGAGIGGGWNEAGGTVTISGGTVTATGGDNGAGIGGGNGGAGGTATISGGTVTATGGDNGAGIGGGNNGAGGTAIISGGSVKAIGDTQHVAENIGHGSGSGDSGTLKNGSGSDAADVYLNTLTVDENGQKQEISVNGKVTIDENYSYGTQDVSTMDGGKLYFYLPNNMTNPEIAVTHNGVTYSRNYPRNSTTRDQTYTATLLPPAQYTITIPGEVDFGSVNWKDTAREQTFEVTPSNLANLTDGRSLSVTVRGSGDQDAFAMKAGTASLNYEVYQGSVSTGKKLDPRDTFASQWDNQKTDPQTGFLRLDPSQLKYSGDYTGQLIFTVNLDDVRPFDQK